MKNKLVLNFCVAAMATATSFSTASAQDEAAINATKANLAAVRAMQDRNRADTRTLYRATAPSQSRANPFGIAHTQLGYFNLDPAIAKEMNESNQRIADAVKGIKEAESDDQKAQFKDEIKSELDSQYEKYLAQHEKPLLELEERLAKLRKEFESRKQAKDDLVNLRLDTIWYDALGLGWPGRSGRVGGPSLWSTPGSLATPMAPGIPPGNSQRPAAVLPQPSFTPGSGR